MTRQTVVSSPGKVLLAGGYLILDPAFSGIVVSTSSRFYTVVRGDTDLGPNRLRVCSPQFVSATWEYAVALQDAMVMLEPLAKNSSKNKFVQLALQSVISLASECIGAVSLTQVLSKGLDIVIAGDNDFYSQRAKLKSLGLPRTYESLSKLEPFASTGVKISEVHKTGLGSSAALITSLVSALLVHLSVIPAWTLSSAADNADRRLAHNLAQYVHCLAQGKVGSGFDVSAAVFGSHLYTRFNPVVLHRAMDEKLTPAQLLAVVSPTNTEWNHRVVPFKLPPLTRIMLADVDAGSDTPSLVGKVLQWRKEKTAEADALWRDLDQLNQCLAQTLLRLSKLFEEDPENYTSAVKYISSLQPIQWSANPWQPPAEMPIVAAFYEAHCISQAVRVKMRDMGAASGVPIEPAEQTRLLDACVTQAGVIGGGVPGAGGYDAIWLLVVDPVECAPDLSPIERVEHILLTYEELTVSPLSVTESKGGGARVEDLADILGLRNAVDI